MEGKERVVITGITYSEDRDATAEVEKSDESAEAGLCADQLLAGRSSRGRAHSAPRAGTSHGGHRLVAPLAAAESLRSFHQNRCQRGPPEIDLPIPGRSFC